MPMPHKFVMDSTDLMSTTGNEDSICSDKAKGGDSFADDGDDGMKVSESVDGSHWLDDDKCTVFNGKHYRDLTLDDLKNVVFKSVEEAEKFYLYYSVAKGFSMRKHKLGWNSKKTLIIRRQMVCSRQGERNNKDGLCYKNRKGNVDKALRISVVNDSNSSCSKKNNVQPPSSRSRRLSRQHCSAQITVNFDSKRGGYYASSFKTEHNHPLTQPIHTPFIRANRGVKEHDIAQVISLRKVSVGTARAYEFLVHQAGGHEFVGFTERDLYNRVQRENNKLRLEGDAQCCITWMNMKAIRDPNFFCLFNVYEDGRLANMLWRDGQSFTDYCSYGDVLVFDSTYKTNIYGRPLAVFVGTNNHRATVIFGCALLVDETEETYNWVLTAFLASMKQKKPVSVITDSDEAMRKALDNVMPEARQRLCAWHVGKNAVSHLRDPGTLADFFHHIFAGMSIEEWEVSWQYFVSMNKLQTNPWICRMYNKRQRWAEAFFRDQFYAGISSTQRCEGMHRILKVGIGSCMTMSEMMPRLEKSAARLRNRGLYDDYMSDQFSPILKSHMLVLEEDISRIFTHDIYLLTRDQIIFESKFSVAGRVVNEDSGANVVTITQYGKPERKWNVVYQPDKLNPTFACSCKLFESDGIPCCHIFCVMKAENVTKFPPSLVKKRWTKEGSVTEKSESTVDGKSVQMARYGELMSMCGQICHIASNSEEGYDGVKDVLSRLTIESRTLPQPTDTDPKDLEHGIDSSTGLHRNVIRDPVPCKSKGTKRNNGSGQQNKKKKKRRCGDCRQYGHNKRSCVKHGTKGKNNVSLKSDTDGMGPRSSDMEGDLSTDESSDRSGSSDVDVGDEETLKTCKGKLYHHLEEARTFEFISGEDNKGASSGSSRGGEGGYFQHFRPFTDSA
ncbi:hypothetical protein ACLB2K_060415 [Fragaria x ananassa]